MIFRDDLGGRHHGDRHVGHIALESDQGLGAGQVGLIEDAVVASALDESRCLGLLLAGDDGPGSGFLRREGFLVAAGPLGRVRPDRPPCPSVVVGVPDRLGTQLGGIDLGVAVPRRHGIDDLSVGENISIPMEVRFQIPGRLGHTGADDERQLHLIERCEVGL